MVILKVAKPKGLHTISLQFLRSCSIVKKDESYFITTPIFYVNADPHIGHVYSALLADAQKRFQYLLGKKDILFCTGTDEHGLKIQRAAAKAGSKPDEYCDKISSLFRDVFTTMQISSTAFVRTSEESHKRAVTHFWKTLDDGQYIYKDQYEGWYSAADETFVPQSQIVEKTDTRGHIHKFSLESDHPLEWTSEENYMFRLSRFQKDLLHWLKKDDVIKPKKFHTQVLREVEKGLADISVSRNAQRLPWGIPVPRDPSQTIYVWLDALVNYLTASGYPNRKHWPPDCHVLGKEILKFHAIYWPAFLMAANLEPPRSLLVHSHWTVEHQKMSKSKGNVVDPMSAVQKFTVDGLRYFLLREGVPHSDGSYFDLKVTTLLNSELADTLGNLLNRCTAKSLNPLQLFTIISPSVFHEKCQSGGKKLVETIRELPRVVRDHYTEFNYYHGLEAVMDAMRAANLFVQSQEPWTLKDRVDHLNTVLGVAFETLRVGGIVLQPVVPDLADRLLTKLGIPRHCRTWNHADMSFDVLDGRPSDWEGKPLGCERSVLFQKLKEKPVETMKNEKERKKSESTG